MICFFLVVLAFVIYLQVINENWKYLVPKPELPDSCNDREELQLVIHDEDKIDGRSFKDKKDLGELENQIHTIFLLPCEREDRKLDINLKIQSSLLAINTWFQNKSLKQQINFDKTSDGNIDVTFLRVNKSMNWFINSKKYNGFDDEKDVSEKVEDIISINQDKFNNYNNKKFIVFFEGWEKRKYINYDICGKSRYNGQVAVYFTSSPFKKYIGNNIILKNNKRIFTCTKNDHLNDYNDLRFGDAEVTILHEILHILGAPSTCGKNLDKSKNHVVDSKDDILYRISGNNYLDFNNDDYYNHKIDNCFDLKNSNYLTQ
tara:strand:+ start:652 stop:1602 length:951 start_codon:yes stop_codon:yes gene_type:complete